MSAKIRHATLCVVWSVLPKSIKVALYLAHRRTITQRIAVTGKSWA